MFFIKECPNCKNKIRFPINKGKIIVKCKCGHSFEANPDDPSLFKNGIFDITDEQNNQKEKKKFFPNLSIKEIISKLYQFKYYLQNIKYMESKKQLKLLKKLMLLIILIILTILVIKLDK